MHEDLGAPMVEKTKAFGWENCFAIKAASYIAIRWRLMGLRERGKAYRAN